MELAEEDVSAFDEMILGMDEAMEVTAGVLGIIDELNPFDDKPPDAWLPTL